MARIASRHKSKVLNENDIIEWCQEVEIDSLGNVDQMYTYVEFPLTVKNFQVLVPCNAYRIIDVYTTPGDASSRVPFTRLRRHLAFSPDSTFTQVYIDYYGLPIELKTGIPMIQAGHEAACEAYCVHSLYYEDILNGKVAQYAAQLIINNMQAEVLAAAGSYNIRHKTREDINRSVAIRFNLIPSPAGMNLIKGTWV